jgi:hypothetical protein
LASAEDSVLRWDDCRKPAPKFDGAAALAWNSRDIDRLFVVALGSWRSRRLDCRRKCDAQFALDKYESALEGLNGDEKEDREGGIARASHIL